MLNVPASGKRMASFFLAACCACALHAAEPLKWVQSPQKDELREGSKLVLSYLYATQLPAGVAADRARCCYLYPLLTPGGVNVLDDFPKDHPHHRGIFWAWPYVGIGGEIYDVWDLRGLKAENVSHKAEIAAGGKLATLNVDNVWAVNGKRVATLHERYVIHPSEGASRKLELELVLTALDAPMTLKGSHEAEKSYGGFNVRFGPREQTVIRTEAGVSEKDQDLNPHPWAELEALYNGRRAALRIDNDPANPGGIPEMTLRHYGFLGVSYPGKTPQRDSVTLEPGQPLTLRYTVRVSDR